MKNYLLLIITTMFLVSGCAGVKVVRPGENKNAGTLALDENGKLVNSFTCNIVASNGKRVSAIGKTEKEAREEAIAKCRDMTIVSVCLEKNVKCTKS